MAKAYEILKKARSLIEDPTKWINRGSKGPNNNPLDVYDIRVVKRSHTAALSIVLKDAKTEAGEYGIYLDFDRKLEIATRGMPNTVAAHRAMLREYDKLMNEHKE